MNDKEVEEGDWEVTSPSAPAFGALVYDPDFVLIERAARAKARSAGWMRAWRCRPTGATWSLKPTSNSSTIRRDGARAPYTGHDPYAEHPDPDRPDHGPTRTCARRATCTPTWPCTPPSTASGRTATTSPTRPTGYDEPLCGVTDKEDPDPPDPAHSGQVLDPVIDWCNFPARLRQSVREAANLRMIFGQQFMVDAMGLHFSGTEFYGGEDAVRTELAQMRAAKHQYELAKQGLAEALGRAVGSGCYVSDFYTQSEWSLLSRAMENQETAQHHIAVRLSYLDIDSPEEVPQVHAVAQDAFRQASIEGYIRLIGMASLGAAQPLGVGCDVGERPDGLLAAEMAANLLETRRKAREMADGRNVFGFDVTFTPARPFKNTAFQTCEATGPGERGLWDEAWCAAEYAKELQNDEVDNTPRLRRLASRRCWTQIEEIQEGIDARIVAASGCTNQGDDEAWYAVCDRPDRRPRRPAASL